MFDIPYIRTAVNKRLLKSLSILFVALLLLQSVVSIFVYDSKLKKIRRKFKWETILSLKDEHLTLVKIAKSLEEKPNQHFKRIHGKEFQFLGEMYDIVRKTEYTDTTYYYCFHDVDESEIIRNINRWMHDNFGNSKANNETGDIQKDFFEKDYLAVAAFSCKSFSSGTKFYFIEETKLHIGFVNCYSPPPEFIG